MLWMLNISIFAMDRSVSLMFKEVFAVRHLCRCWVKWPKAQTLWAQLAKFKAHNLASALILHCAVSVKPQFLPETVTWMDSHVDTWLFVLLEWQTASGGLDVWMEHLRMLFFEMSFISRQREQLRRYMPTKLPLVLSRQLCTVSWLSLGARLSTCSQIHTKCSKITSVTS